MFTSTSVRGPFVIVETLDGGEFVCQRKCIVGCDTRTQGISSRHSLLVQIGGELAQIINLEVSASVYEKFKADLLGDDTDA